MIKIIKIMKTYPKVHNLPHKIVIVRMRKITKKLMIMNKMITKIHINRIFMEIIITFIYNKMIICLL